MAQIHPTSIVEDGATLGPGVVVGPFCHVGPSVTLGPGTTLKSHVVVMGRTTLGADNELWPFATLGGDPQDLKFNGEDSQLILGDRNVVRENVTIHKGTDNDHGLTRIGDDNLIMVDVHIGHDCLIGNRIVIANGVGLSGHILIEDHAVIGGMCGMHEFVTVGKYAYVAGRSRVTKDIPPFMKVAGNPAVVRLFNDVGLKRHRFEQSTIAALRDAWKKLYKRNGDGSINREGVLIELLDRYGDNDAIQHLVASVQNSRNGVHGRYRERCRRDNAFTNPVK